MSTDLETADLETADRVIGECHYCAGTVVLRFAGQLGSAEVWVRRHAEGMAGHEAWTSAEVWSSEDDGDGTDLDDMDDMDEGTGF